MRGLRILGRGNSRRVPAPSSSQSHIDVLQARYPSASAAFGCSPALVLRLITQNGDGSEIDVYHGQDFGLLALLFLRQLPVASAPSEVESF